AVDRDRDRAVGGGDHAVGDDADLLELAAERHARVGGGGRSADRGRVRTDLRLGEGMRNGKGHGDSPENVVSTVTSCVGAGFNPAPTGAGGGAYDVVRSNTPPEDFSLRETSAYSERICFLSESPVLASGIETMRRPLRKASAHISICSTSTSR